MRDKYIKGVAIPVYDEKITQALELVDPDGGGPMNIAIENEEGLVYRVVTAEGTGELLDVTGILEDLGMTDKLYESKHASKEGFDCRFHF